MDLNCFIRISGLREAAVSTGGLTGSAVLFAEKLRFSDADVFSSRLRRVSAAEPPGVRVLHGAAELLRK